MDKINYTDLKHRGSTGRDIPNIYFCTHHDDRELHLDKIYDALSKEIECALWYDESPSLDADIKKLSLEFDQMSLLVVPVTKRLMTTESRAIKDELPLAKEKGIPVLPLVAERIDDDDFNEQFARIFGNMQYLVFNQDDPTAISFKDKLKNYLSSVLVSPGLSERIRDSFDGYIFLSYRKKDREHVIPLMKTIHQSSELRDVAVWYDEFLTPGEDFSNNIEKNLKKSNIFMLAVTPNILEKGNYVMTTEYPFAIKNKKPVVAVEMVKTSREALDKEFEDLPACIPSGGSEVLCTQLKSKLSLEKVERDKKSELEHKFLMGLAYFSGIDLETDKDRALDLLEETADEGYLEAMEQLSSFYNNDIGIRSLDARERQMKYVLLCKDRYEHEGTERSALRFADALGALGNLEDSLIKFGEFDPSKLGHHPVPHASILMIALLEKTNDKYKTPKTKRKLIAAYDSICERYTITRRNGMVVDFALKSIAILDDMANINYDTELYENISNRYLHLSNEVLVGAEKALEYQQRSMLYYNKAKGKDRSPETLKGYLDILNSMSLSLLHRFYDKYADGKIILKNMLELSRELAEKVPSRDNKLSLCDRYLKCSDYIVDYPPGFQLFDPEERLDLCDRAEELINEIYGDEDSSSKEFFNRITKLLEAKAMAYNDAEIYDRAAEYYLKYILKLDSPPADITREKYDSPKANAYLELSRIFEKMGFSGRAKKCALNSVGSGKLKIYQYSEILKEYVGKEDADTLDAFMASGLEHYESLLNRDVDLQRDNAPDLLCSFVSETSEAYDICLKNGQTDTAIKYLQSSTSACRRLIEKVSTRQNQRCLFNLLAKLGDFYIRTEDRTAAAEALIECAAMGNSIGDDELLLDELRLLANVYRTLAIYAEEEGDLERAESYYIFSLKRHYRIFLINEDKEEIKNGTAPLNALYKRQGNAFFVIKKTLALAKQIKQWENE